MAKKKVTFILIVLMFALIVFGFVFTLVNDGRDDKILSEITIDGKAKQEHQFTIENLNLAPGKKVKNEIKLNFVSASNYKLIFEFIETEDGGLKNYVDVTMNYGKTNLCDGILLDKVFKDGEMEMTYTHESENATVVPLIIVYSMPELVGDGLENQEQQIIMGSSAKFDLKITVERV